ncbi:MAG TPA: type II secretion system minor pseudopilin GspI [Gammaproteobacteria bacterium]
MDSIVAERPRAAGFTLLEAMVALVIVALGMMAVNTQLNRYVVTSSYIEEKTLASWIGANKIAELSVAQQWPELGDEEEEIEFAGRLWRARIEVSETPVENLRRVDVEIALADAPERTLHKISGILEPPTPRGFLATQWLQAPTARFGAPGRGRRGMGRDRDEERSGGDEGEREGFEGGAFERGGQDE